MLKTLRRLLSKKNDELVEKKHKMYYEQNITSSIFRAKINNCRVIVKKKHKNYNSVNEVAILKKIANCPSCMRLIDETPNYVVVNYFDGGDLHNFYTTSTESFSLQKSCCIVYELCGILQKLHECGVYHLDLKLDNICFHKEDFTKVFLIDFANSEIVDDKKISSLVTTRTYMSPDYIEIICDLTEKKKSVLKSRLRYIDVWSVGVILYVLLFGRYPFDTPSKKLSDTIIKVQNLDYKIPEKKEIPPEIHSLIGAIFIRDGWLRPSFEEIRLILELFI